MKCGSKGARLFPENQIQLKERHAAFCSLPFCIMQKLLFEAGFANNMPHILTRHLKKSKN
jgi:hypothetical protein